jgi:hypothetical protein
MEPLISIERAAELLGISPWVRADIRDKKLKPLHIGARVLLEPSEIRRLLKAAKQTKREPGGR